MIVFVTVKLIKLHFVQTKLKHCQVMKMKNNCTSMLRKRLIHLDTLCLFVLKMCKNTMQTLRCMFSGQPFSRHITFFPKMACCLDNALVFPTIYSFGVPKCGLLLNCFQYCDVYFRIKNKFI